MISPKVLFCNVPFLETRNGELYTGPNAGSCWPHTVRGLYSYVPFPFFLSNATSYLQAHGIVAMMFDAWAERITDYAKVLQGIMDRKPSILVLECATPLINQILMIAKATKDWLSDCKIVLVGPHVHAYADQLLELPYVDHVVAGEYDLACLKIAQGNTRRKIMHEYVPNIDNVNGVNWMPYRDPRVLPNYLDPSMVRTPIQLQVNTSRGCSYKCLAGDTPVNTVYGHIPIKELVDGGIESIGVFTYDHGTGKAKVSTATKIRSFGKAVLVRVHFDDGTHTDCTPDHQFLAFKWGNQHVGETECPVEAGDLQEGMHLRAIKQSLAGAEGSQYPSMMWKRTGQKKAHRMVMEWKLGRDLLESEHVHHKDHNKMNFAPENLEVYASAQEHFDRHPEVAQRMRDNNPTKNMTEEWGRNISKATKGLKKSEETKARMSEGAKKRYLDPAQRALASKLSKGRKYSPEALARMAEGQRKRYARPEEREKMRIVNHRVVSVEVLEGEHEVYCLTVEDTGWFYANNVLVKNCSFCSWPATMYRRRHARKAENVLDEIRTVVATNPIGSIFFDDEMFNAGDPARLEAIAKGMGTIGLPWSFMGRIDTSKREMLELFVANGCVGMRFGVESFHQHLLDRVNKKLDVQKSWEMCQWILTHFKGLHVRLLTMRHLPGETLVEELKDAELFTRLQQIGLENGNRVDIQTADCVALPGTELWDQLQAAGQGDKMTDFKEFNAHPDHGAPLQKKLDTYNITVKGKDT